MFGPPLKVLFVRPDYIGDCVLTWPTAAGLKKSYGNNIEIDGLFPSIMGPITPTNVFDTLFFVNKDYSGGQSAERQDIDFSVYDHIFLFRDDRHLQDLYKHIRKQNYFVHSILTPITFSDNPDYRNQAEPQTIPYFSEMFSVLHHIPHAVDSFDFQVSKVLPHGHQEVWENFIPVMPKDPKKIIINPFTSTMKKNFSLEFWLGLSQELVKRSYEIIFISGEKVEFTNQSGIRNLTGQCSLQETMDLIASAFLHIAGDTGTSHLAAAVSTRTISLFTCTDPILGGPYPPDERNLALSDPTIDQVLDAVDQQRNSLNKKIQNLSWYDRMRKERQRFRACSP